LRISPDEKQPRSRRINRLLRLGSKDLGLRYADTPIPVQQEIANLKDTDLSIVALESTQPDQDNWQENWDLGADVIEAHAGLESSNKLAVIVTQGILADRLEKYADALGAPVTIKRKSVIQSQRLILRRLDQSVQSYYNRATKWTIYTPDQIIPSIQGLDPQNALILLTIIRWVRGGNVVRRERLLDRMDREKAHKIAA